MGERVLPDTTLVYKVLELNPDGISLQALAQRSEVPLDRLEDVLRVLQKDGLTWCRGEQVFAVKWWDSERLEIVFGLPWVSDDAFAGVCDHVKTFAKSIDHENYRALKPYSHETTIAIILSIGSGILLGEFFRAFMAEFGKKAAGFSEALFKRYSRDGVNEVSISGTYHPAPGSGRAKFNFEVKGASKKELLDGLDFVEKELVSSIEARGLSSELVKRSGDWKITVWKA